MLVPVFISMKLVLMIEPISSSSKEARSAISFLASSSMNSISVVLSPFGRDFRYSVALSVSKSLNTAIFFFTLISFKYVEIFSVYSKMFASVSESKIR